MDANLEQYLEKAKQVSTPILEIAQEMVVDSDDRYEGAARRLKEIKSVSKALDADRRSLTDPLNATVKNINSRYKEPLGVLREAEATIKRKMVNYQSILEEMARQEQAEIDRKAEKERARKERLAEKAIERGDLDRAEKHMQAAEEIQAPIVAPSTAPKAEGISFRETWHYEIKDVEKIPRDYMTPNTEKIGRVVRATKGCIEIPGVRIFSKKDIAARS